MNFVNGLDPAHLGLRQLVANIGKTLGRQLLALLFGLGTTVVVARLLGPEGNGQYAITLLLPTFLATFLNLGIGPANVYYIGRRLVTPHTVSEVIIRIWFVITLIGATVGVFSILFYSESLFPGVPDLLLWIALLGFPLTILQEYLSSLLQAVQDFRRYNLAVIASPGIMFVLVSLFLIMRGNVAAVVIASTLVQLINLTVTYFLTRPLLTRDFDTNTNDGLSKRAYTKQVIQYGFKAHLSNILTFINYRVDLFLVNLLLNPAATGLYVIAIALSEKLWLLSQSIAIVILPRLSELDQEEETRRQLTPFLARWTLITTAVGAALLAILAPYLIRILFGQAYVGVVKPMLLLLPGIVVWSLVRVLANDIAARGRPELNLYNVAAVIVINIIGNLLLLPRMGIAGAALATTLAYTLACCLEIAIYSQVSKNPWYAIFKFNAHDAKVLKWTIYRR